MSAMYRLFGWANIEFILYFRICRNVVNYFLNIVLKNCGALYCDRHQWQVAGATGGLRLQASAFEVK
jgi:hypothetical protein